MKAALKDILPAKAEIDIEDVGDLFFQYFSQSITMTPHRAAREWLEMMNAVCLENWGCELDFTGVFRE